MGRTGQEHGGHDLPSGHMGGRRPQDGRADRLQRAWAEEDDPHRKEERWRGLLDAIFAEEVPLGRMRRGVIERIGRAERDASCRAGLFGAVREMVGEADWIPGHDGEDAVRMVTVLLDAGVPMATREVMRRVKERWGRWPGETAIYAAKFSGAIDEDVYGVLSLGRQPGHGIGPDEAWMYEALQKAVRFGVARYTGGGIEMTGGGEPGGLTARELAGAEAVMAGVNAHGAPPGLAEWLAEHGGFTWAEATVRAHGAPTEVRAALAAAEAKSRD